MFFNLDNLKFDSSFVKNSAKLKPILELDYYNKNVFYLLDKARSVAIENNMDWDIIINEAISDNYSQLLRTLIKYFNVKYLF